MGGINTSADPGMINEQDLVLADNVVFSSTGARIKREAFEYLDNDLEVPDFRSSSGTTRTLKWTTSTLIGITNPDERLVVGERINVTGNSNYNVSGAEVLSITSIPEVTSVTCVADVAGSLAGRYFLISAGDSGTNYYIWFKVSGSGSDPAIVGRTGVEIAISTNDSATAVAAAVAAVLNPMSDFAASSSLAVLTITNALGGLTTDAAAGNSGFSVSVTTQGGHSITYTASDSLTEGLTAAGGITVERASKVIMEKDYWRYVDGTNEQMFVYATDQFQLFRLDESGRRVQIHGQEQISTVTTAAASTLTTGDYFLLNGPNNETNYYVWYNKASGGGDPLVANRTGIQVAVGSGDTDAQVATATASAIDAVADFSASASLNVVTITASGPGITDDLEDVNTGFTFAVTTYGATAPLEAVDTIRTNVFNERLQIYFSGLGNYPVIYNPEENAKYQPFLTAPDASFAFNHLSRVWTNDKTNRDRLNYSETFDETKWFGVGDSGAIDFIPGEGDREGITNAYPYKGLVIASKKDARFRMSGDSPENFRPELISYGMGNEGSFSIPVDEQDVFFISKRGLHSQQVTDQYGDTDAAYLSSSIKPDFNAFENANLIQGAYIPELNSVAIAVQQEDKDDQNDVWLYNIEVMPPGKNAPGVWYRWPDVSCTALTRRFINNKHKLVFGTANGRIIQAQKEGDYADFGTDGISYRIKTGTIYPGNDPQNMKAFRRISMIYRPKGNFSFAVQAKIDNHEQQGFAFNEISGLDLLGESFILGSSLLGSSNTLAPFTFTMDGYGRGVTLTVTQPSADEQIEIWGFIIEWENADLEQEAS